MKKFKKKCGIELDVLESNRDILEQRLEKTKRGLNDYIANCKMYNDTPNPIIVSDLEKKISKIDNELKKLNSSISKYEVALLREKKLGY